MKTSHDFGLCQDAATANLNRVCTGPLPAAGLSRRHFLNRFGMGLGGIALAHLLGGGSSEAAENASPGHAGILGPPHFPPKAKRVIYLFMAGGPSQLET